MTPTPSTAEPSPAPELSPSSGATAVRAAGAGPGSAGVRGRRQSVLLRIRGELDLRWRIVLAAAGLLVPIVAWWIASVQLDRPNVLPTPPATLSALWEMATEGTLWTDGWASVQRILIGYSISVVIGMVLGIAIGTFASFESFFEAPIGFLRYIPATALTPVLLLWLGIGESPKVWLIVVGTMFFNILMMADAARNVPRPLLHASYTLGAGRLTVLRRVVLRFSLPGIIDAARINLAAAWLMLVVAEVLASDSGLAYQIVRSSRFRAIDKVFALLLVLGMIGLCSDLFLRWFRNRVAPWARG